MSTLIHPLALEAEALCQEMTLLAHDYCLPEDYMAKGTALKKALVELAELGEFGALAILSNLTSHILGDSAYEKLTGKKAHSMSLQFEALEFHLKTFGCHPEKLREYVWGDPALDRLIVNSVLRSEPPTYGMEANSWISLGRDLAKKGSVQAWDHLFTELVKIDGISSFAGSSAVISIADFSQDVLLDHSQVFQRHVDQYAEASGTNPNYYKLNLDSTPVRVREPVLYDALETIDRLDIAYRYMNNDLTDDKDLLKIQKLMHRYQWSPDKNWDGYRNKRRYWGRSSASNSIILQLLTQEDDSVSIIFDQKDSILRALSFHNTEHDFGKIEFTLSKIAFLINSAYDLTRGKNKYSELKADGFTDAQLALCERLNEERLGIDLGM